jgi:hypothetical protein
LNLNTTDSKSSFAQNILAYGLVLERVTLFREVFFCSFILLYKGKIYPQSLAVVRRARYSAVSVRIVCSAVPKRLALS